MKLRKRALVSQDCDAVHLGVEPTAPAAPAKKARGHHFSFQGFSHERRLITMTAVILGRIITVALIVATQIVVKA